MAKKKESYDDLTNNQLSTLKVMKKGKQMSPAEIGNMDNYNGDRFTASTDLRALLKKGYVERPEKGVHVRVR
jgi:hypothetical protein